MPLISENGALERIEDLFAEWLKVSKSGIRIKQRYNRKKVDGFFKVGQYRIIIEIKSGSNSAQVTSAINFLKSIPIQPHNSVFSLVVVPFMGEVGRNICENSGISWADLSGNADIYASNLRILIKGRPNLFRGPGRPSSPFAPKSARIARWLLINAGKPISQRELSLETKVDEGQTSRIISRLEDEELIIRKNNGSIVVSNPDIMLDSWREKYDFKKNRIIKGHMAARSSSEILKKISDHLSDMNIIHAATGLSGAWLYNKFVNFRIVSFYIEEQLPKFLFNSFGFREEARGSNVWFVVPKDKGVFQGIQMVEGISCAHPVQVYLDLFSHPERAIDAANELRKNLWSWNKHD